VESGPLTMKVRIGLTKRLGELVGHLYNLSMKDYEYIINSFTRFLQYEDLEVKEIKWSNTVVRKFNKHMRKKLLKFYDDILQEGWHKFKKEIIDNQKDNYTMSEFLNDQLNHNGNTGEMEISTGYFNISGYKLLSKSLWRFSKNPKFRLRLLFGKEAIRQDKSSKSFEERLDNIQLESSLESSLTNISVNDGTEISIENGISEMRVSMISINSQDYEI
jgi:hypothetical protein